MTYNINKIRKDFKILDKKVNGEKLIYFDSAATSLTPKPVINEIVNYYENYNANYSRGVATISNDVTLKIEQIRQKIANFFNIVEYKNIVFTKNTTESINIISNGLVSYLKPNDEILLTKQEHHANILPWIHLASQTKAIIKYIPLQENGSLDVDSYLKMLSNKTKIVSIAQIGSTLGYVNDVEKICKIVKQNSSAFVIVDGAQSAGHIKVDLSFKPDAFVCSAHKMLGPTGVGILYLSDSLDKVLKPLNYGGSMVNLASEFDFETKKIPYKYEAGTLNLSSIFGFGAAIDYINEIGIDNIDNHITNLTKYFYKKIKNVENICFYNDLSKSHGIVSFNIIKVHSHETSSDLDKIGIQTRAGSHCSQIYFATLKEDNSVRISFYIYNTYEEIDLLVKKIKVIINEWNITNKENLSHQELLQELKKLKQMR